MYDTDIDYNAIGRRIRDARKKKNISQQEVAWRVGVKDATISHIESGNKFRFATLVKIANVLGVTLDELMCDNLSAAQPEFIRQIAEELNGCTADEVSGYLDLIRAAKKIVNSRAFECPNR